MNIIKKICNERQIIRLHIEAMKATREGLRQRAKHHGHDLMAYTTARNAVNRLNDKIERAETELHILERRWTF